MLKWVFLSHQLFEVSFISLDCVSSILKWTSIHISFIFLSVSFSLLSRFYNYQWLTQCDALLSVQHIVYALWSLAMSVTWTHSFFFLSLTSGRWNEHKTIGLLGEDIWTSWTVIKPIAQLVVDAELSHKRHENLLGHLGVSSLHCNLRSLYACIEHLWGCMCLIRLFQGLFCEPLNNRVVNKEDGWKISENVMPTFRFHAFNIIYFRV